MQEWYRIPMGGNESPRDLLYAGKYNLLGFQMEEFIDAQVFGQKRFVGDDILVPFTFDAVDFYPRWHDIVRELRKRKLRRPTVEHALRFGVLFPDEQRECPYFFPHKPWRGYGNQGYALFLQGNNVGRRIDVSSIQWPRGSGAVYLGLKPRSK